MYKGENNVARLPETGAPDRCAGRVSASRALEVGVPVFCFNNDCISASACRRVHVGECMAASSGRRVHVGDWIAVSGWWRVDGGEWTTVSRWRAEGGK